MSNKISLSPNNDLAPQTLFTFGTFKEDGTPNFGLFCWFSYCWLEDLAVMCCIGAPKMTQDRIRATGVFSANLVTESNLALSDYFGTADGHDADKMDVPFQWERGQVLDVPVLTNCPFIYELEVDRTIPLNEAEDINIYICRIRNVLKDAELVNSDLPEDELMRKVGAVRTAGGVEYWSWDGRHLGAWHEPAQTIKPGVEVGKAAQM